MNKVFRSLASVIFAGGLALGMTACDSSGHVDHEAVVHALRVAGVYQGVAVQFVEVDDDVIEAQFSLYLSLNQVEDDLTGGLRTLSADGTLEQFFNVTGTVNGSSVTLEASPVPNSVNSAGICLSITLDLTIDSATNHLDGTFTVVDCSGTAHGTVNLSHLVFD